MVQTSCGWLTACGKVVPLTACMQPLLSVDSDDVEIVIRDSTRSARALAPAPSALFVAATSSSTPAIVRLAAITRPLLAQIISLLDARSLAALCEATQVAISCGSQPPALPAHRIYTPPMTSSKASSAAIASAANADELWDSAFGGEYSAYLQRGWLRVNHGAKRYYLEQVAIAHHRYGFCFLLLFMTTEMKCYSCRSLESVGINFWKCAIKIFATSNCVRCVSYQSD